MAWYKTGTVDVTNSSTAVTATGTKFASNARVGDGFRGPDGEWYEIVNIASETVLGIYPAYQGATVAASSNYMIAPLQGYNKESADRLRAITDSIRDFTADVEAAAASAAAALVSQNAALVSENNAKTSEDAAKVSEDNAKASELAAQSSEDDAALSESNAALSSTSAANSAAAALVSENAASLSETNADASEAAAANSAAAALISENNSKTSETNSKASELEAKASELSADADATTATTQATAAINAKTAAETAQAIAEQARDEAIEAAGTVTGNLMDQGPWDAATGVYPTKPAVSSFWKVISNGSATDSGETISYGIGDTLMFSKPMENFYKIDNTENVSAVNGHTGIVVLDKTDIGLPNVDNTSDVDKPISTAQATVNTSVTTSLGEKVPKTDIVDDLTSTDATKVLSAKQGKALYDLVQSNNATIVRYNFVATAGQTTFSGADANGVVLSYVPGTPMLVTLNGFDLNLTDDYTASNGTSIVMTQALVAGDQVSVVVFGAFSVANHYTKAEDDALLAGIVSNYGVDSGYISGLIPSRHATTSSTLIFSGGSAIIPSTGKLLRVTTPITVALAGSVSNAAWHYAYLYDSGGGVPAIEVNTTAPDAPYSGTARAKTGDTSRRYLGSFLSYSTTGFWLFQFLPSGMTHYLEYVNTAPFRVLVNATSIYPVTQSLSAAMPPTTRTVMMNVTANIGTAEYTATISNPDIQPRPLRYVRAGTNSAQTSELTVVTDASQQISRGISGNGGSMTIDIVGYGNER